MAGCRRDNQSRSVRAPPLLCAPHILPARRAILDPKVSAGSWQPPSIRCRRTIICSNTCSARSGWLHRSMHAISVL